MTPSDFLATLSRLHLTPPEAARLLGYHKRTVYRWLAGRATVPPCVMRFLLACERDATLAPLILALNSVEYGPFPEFPRPASRHSLVVHRPSVAANQLDDNIPVSTSTRELDYTVRRIVDEFRAACSIKSFSHDP